MAQTDILEYLRKTPHNTNVNVVKTMLNAEGGSGGGVEPLIVNIVESADTAICDKTAGEIKAALDNGVLAYFKVVTTTEGWSNGIKIAQITSVETEERAGETEGVFDEFTVSFGSTNGTYSTMSNTSLEDALSKYPETN